MGEFSRPPQEVLAQSRAAGYVGVQFQEGVPLLDRDLNLAGDLVAAVTRAVVARYIGDGVAADQDGFRIEGTGAANDVTVQAGDAGVVGTFLVGGIEVRIDAPVAYSQQPQGGPPLTTPPAGGAATREDTVYLDAWLTTVGAEEDPALSNHDDVGRETALRLRPAWAVRVAEGSAAVPPPADGHAHAELARLTRRAGQEAITAATVLDRRPRRLTLSDLQRRVDQLERRAQQPVITSFDPQVGAPPTKISIRGQNLDLGDPSVTVGGVPATVLPTPSSVLIEARLGDATPPGGQFIVVTTGVGPAQSNTKFQVSARPPVISDVTPRQGAQGTKITITGVRLTGASDVNLGDAFADSPNATSDTTMTALIPDIQPGDYDLTVTVQGRTSDPFDHITVL